MLSLDQQLPAFIFYIGAIAAVLFILAMLEGIVEWRRNRLERRADDVLYDALRECVRAAVWAWAIGGEFRPGVEWHYERLLRYRATGEL